MGKQQNRKGYQGMEESHSLEREGASFKSVNDSMQQIPNNNDPSLYNVNKLEKPIEEVFSGYATQSEKSRNHIINSGMDSNVILESAMTSTKANENCKKETGFPTKEEKNNNTKQNRLSCSNPEVIDLEDE